MADNSKETDIVEIENYTMSLGEMIDGLEDMPRQKMIYSGIPENGVGFIFGPAKSGKTTFCENLGMSIAAGLDSYLGKPIETENKKVLIISLEEFCLRRNLRNREQWKKLKERIGTDELLRNNYILANCIIPHYIMGDEQWEIIKALIAGHKPGIVFLDSMSRMHGGESIEDSTVGHRVMKKLREMADESKVTIGVVHHTPKLLPNEPLSIFKMAGSRVLGQEADFIIGINKTADKKVYVKDVEFRYAPNDSETVTVVKMDDHQWLNLIGEEDEIKLLSALDGRRDDHNKAAILKFIEEFCLGKDANVEAKDIHAAFVETNLISKETVYKHLGALQKEGKIIKPSKGQYKLPS